MIKVFIFYEPVPATGMCTTLERTGEGWGSRPFRSTFHRSTERRLRTATKRKKTEPTEKKGDRERERGRVAGFAGINGNGCPSGLI